MLQNPIPTLRFLAGDPVGRSRIGQTPHRVVFRQGSATLRCFEPAEVTRAPIVICMPLINTWTIWDLLPDRSVVRALMATGAPVYVVDWGTPGPEDLRLELSDVVDERLGRMLERARRDAGVRELDAIGYCVGGTFLTLHLARNPSPVRRLCLVCTPIDFHASGRLSSWAHPDRFPVDELVAGFGNFPGELMQQSFQWLNPLGTWKKLQSLDRRVEDPEFQVLYAALERWNSTAVDFPGQVYGAYVRGCYFDNGLMKGGWTFGGRTTDLGAASLPVLTVAGDRDHICPPAAAHALERVWGGPVTTRTLPGGHVGLSLDQGFHATLTDWVEQA